MPEPKSPNLHGIFPFSVLRSDMGPWQNRKRAWAEIGLSSDANRAGREHVETYNSQHGWGAKVFSQIGTLSAFDPVLAELAYTWYCPEGGAILDPFAGGPTRGLVAGNLGYDYLGVDLSGQQLAANDALATDWATRDLLAGKVDWVQGDSADVVPTLDTEFDLVFSCPPYHSLEVYSDDPADLSNMGWRDFTTAYRQIIAASVERLKNDRFAIFVVGEIRNAPGKLRGLVPLTISAFEDAGAKFYNDSILLNVVGTVAARMGAGWRTSRKHGRLHQYVLVFVKGDPKTAVAAIDAATMNTDAEQPLHLVQAQGLF